MRASRAHSVHSLTSARRRANEAVVLSSADSLRDSISVLHAESKAGSSLGWATDE